MKIKNLFANRQNKRILKRINNLLNSNFRIEVQFNMDFKNEVRNVNFDINGAFKRLKNLNEHSLLIYIETFKVPFKKDNHTRTLEGILRTYEDKSLTIKVKPDVRK